MKKLLTNQTTNISDAANAVRTTGARKLAVHVFGIFNAATVNIVLSTNGISDGIVLSELVFTSAGMILIDVPDEVTIWAELSGSGGATDISAWVAGLGE